MSKPRRINTAQLTRIYWPAWRKAERVLINTADYSKAEAEEARKEIHIAVTGVACSSKDLTNKTLDECLKRFARISDPKNGARQAELADGPRKRLFFVINQVRLELGMSESSVETIAQTMNKRPLAHCDEAGLIKILQALKIHETRHSKEPAAPQGQA